MFNIFQLVPCLFLEIQHVHVVPCRIEIFVMRESRTEQTVFLGAPGENVQLCGWCRMVCHVYLETRYVDAFGCIWYCTVYLASCKKTEASPSLPVITPRDGRFSILSSIRVSSLGKIISKWWKTRTTISDAQTVAGLGLILRLPPLSGCCLPGTYGILHSTVKRPVINYPQYYYPKWVV